MQTYDQNKIRMLLTRRDFIRSVALASAGMAIVACAPVQPGGAPAPAASGGAAGTTGTTKTVLGDAFRFRNSMPTCVHRTSLSRSRRPSAAAR